jgi:hypothetical protein
MAMIPPGDRVGAREMLASQGGLYSQVIITWSKVNPMGARARR